MTECCLVNTVDRQMSAAHAHASTLRRGLPSASLLWLKAIAMQAELWQWMEGQTFTAASAFHSSCMIRSAGLSRPRVSTAGRSSSPLGRIMYTIRQKVMPENMVRQSLS